MGTVIRYLFPAEKRGFSVVFSGAEENVEEHHKH